MCKSLMAKIGTKMVCRCDGLCVLRLIQKPEVTLQIDESRELPSPAEGVMQGWGDSIVTMQKIHV